MDHAALEGVLQAEGGLARVVARLRDRQRAGLRHQLCQVGALDVFHHEEVRVADVFRIVVMDYVGMRQVAGGNNLARESLDHRRVGDEPAIDHLEGNDAMHEQMFRLEHRAHAADADQAEDAIAWVIGQLMWHLGRWQNCGIGERASRGARSYRTGPRIRAGVFRANGPCQRDEAIRGLRLQVEAARLALGHVRLDGHEFGIVKFPKAECRQLRSGRMFLDNHRSTSCVMDSCKVHVNGMRRT